MPPPPPQKGYLSDIGAIPYKNKANGRYPPLRYYLKKVLGDRRGGVARTGPLRFQLQRTLRIRGSPLKVSRAAKRGGGFQTGGFPDLDLSFLSCPFYLSFFVLLLSFFVLFLSFFWTFPPIFLHGIFPICSGTLRGFARFVLFLFLGLLRAPTRNSPERVRDTICTFSEKSGKPPVWKPPGLASLKSCGSANATSIKSKTLVRWQFRAFFFDLGPKVGPESQKIL